MRQRPGLGSEQRSSQVAGVGNPIRYRGSASSFLRSHVKRPPCGVNHGRVNVRDVHPPGPLRPSPVLLRCVRTWGYEQQCRHGPRSRGIVVHNRVSRDGQSPLDMRYRLGKEPRGGVSRLRGVRLGERGKVSRSRRGDDTIGGSKGDVNHRTVSLWQCAVHDQIVRFLLSHSLVKLVIMRGIPEGTKIGRKGRDQVKGKSLIDRVCLWSGQSQSPPGEFLLPRGKV